MLAPDLVRTIKRLLSEGNLSQREIARQTGVSRGSVSAIALGKRPDYEARRRKKVQDCAERCRNCGVMYLMLYVSGRMRDLIEEVWIESLLREADASLQSRYGGEAPQPTEEIHPGCPTGPTCACRSRCVGMPCLACQLRWLMLAGLIHPAPLGPENPLRLELRPEHRKRYEDVMARRKAKRQRKSRAKVKEYCP